MRDTNKAYGCISSSKKGYSVYFKDKATMDAFDKEYFEMVNRYNCLYHTESENDDGSRT